jgi:3-methyladenine DNA glycosylase AlkD
VLHPAKIAVTTSDRVARTVRRELKTLARPTGDFDASRYFRADGDLGFYNVGTARLRAMAKAVYRSHHATWSLADAMDCAAALLTSRVFDAKIVAVELVACYRKSFNRRLLPVWKRWLSQGHASNWATTDSICGSLIGPLLFDVPDLVPKIAPWAGHPTLWVRRAAVVSLIPSVRRGRALDEAYDIAARLHPDREDLIQKAVGWMLREAGKADLNRLDAYLCKRGPAIPRTTLRYAIERFPVARRQELLLVTR